MSLSHFCRWRFVLPKLKAVLSLKIDEVKAAKDPRSI